MEGGLTQLFVHSHGHSHTHTHTQRVGMMTHQTSEAQERQPPLRSVLIIKRRGEMKGDAPAAVTGPKKE